MSVPKLLQNDFSTAVIWFTWRVMPLIAAVSLVGAVAAEAGLVNPKFVGGLVTIVLLPLLISVSFSHQLETPGIMRMKAPFSGSCSLWILGVALISMTFGFLMTNRMGTFFLIQEYSFTALCMAFGRQLVESTGKKVKHLIINPFLRVLSGVGAKLLFTALELLVFRIVMSLGLFIDQSVWIDGILVFGFLSFSSLHLAMMAVILRRSFHISSDWG